MQSKHTISQRIKICQNQSAHILQILRAPPWDPLETIGDTILERLGSTGMYLTYLLNKIIFASLFSWVISLSQSFNWPDNSRLVQVFVFTNEACKTFAYQPLQALLSTS